MTNHFTPPDLQTLVTEHSAFDQIPTSAWADFDARMAHWLARQRAGLDYTIELARPEIRELRRRPA